MASAGDVKAAQEAVEVEYQPVEASGSGESSMPVTTTTTAEESQPMLQERRRGDDTEPDAADHHDAAVAPASDQAAAEVSASASEEPPDQQKASPPVATKEEAEQPPEAAADDQAAESTRERLKRHRREMAGRVWVPELWGQEKLLKDWVDCPVFDRTMVPAGLLTARRALIAEFCGGTRRPDRTSPASSAGSGPPLRVRNGCS